MVINSTNINKANHHLSSEHKITEHKKTTTYEVVNTGPGLEQTQQCGRVKPVIGCLYFDISLKTFILYTYISKIKIHIQTRILVK